MGDHSLEETIFQVNVPGRWSKHDMFGSDRRGGDDDDDDEGVGEGEDDDAAAAAAEVGDEAVNPHGSLVTDSHSRVPFEVRQRILAERARKTQTGVKGVLADAKAAKALDRAEEQARRDERAAVLRRMVEGHKVPVAEVQAELLSLAQAAALYDDDDDDDSDFDDDEDVLRAFRERRLQELRSGSLPQFGACEDVDAERFVDCLETQDPRTTVCVHLYDSAVPSCARMNRLLDELAPAMPHVKFLRLPSGAGGMALDRDTMPILSLYRAGETHKVLAAIAEELGTELFTREDVRGLLEHHLL